MRTDLKAVAEAALKRKLEAREDSGKLKLDHIDDRAVCEYLSKRSTQYGDRVDVIVLKGEIYDDSTKTFKPIEPGPYSFSISATKLAEIFAQEPLRKGDIFQIVLVGIAQEWRGMKLYGFEYFDPETKTWLKHRPRDGQSGQADGQPPADDDIPEYDVPKAQPVKDRRRKSKGVRR